MTRYALLIIRLTLGIIFIAHGAQKVLGLWGGAGWNGTIAVFAKQGMPAPMTILIMIAELFGGLGVFFGFLTRIAAFGPAIVMLGAIVLVHAKYGFFLNWFLVPGQGHGVEASLAYLAMALAIMIGGPGTLAVDDVLFGGGTNPELDNP